MSSWDRKIYNLFIGGESSIPQTRPGSDFEDVDDAHSTSTGSWTTGASQELTLPRTIKEVTPYFRDTGGSGSATDVRTLVAKDTSLTVSDAPTGSLSDGDGWLELQQVQVASGGEGPDISGSGLECHTHLVVVQTQAVSSGTTGRIQLTGTEAV